MRTPDFEGNLAKVLSRKVPAQPTLFEFIVSDEAMNLMAGEARTGDDFRSVIAHRIRAFARAGYDFVPLVGSAFWFPRKPHVSAESYSLNDGGSISDWESFEQYDWESAEPRVYDAISEAEKLLPDGMKILAYCPDGILENVIGICGYETLCYLLADDRKLVEAIFARVGERIERYLTRCASMPSVGVLFCNDDWGFHSSTMISHADLRELVYPYYKRISAAAHANGKYCAMHSCGNFRGIYEDLYQEIGFDGKHSNEDSILPVETAYEQYADRIAILGGMDIDFLCRATQTEIADRCKAMLRRSAEKGSYALGSGNSIARYVPLESFVTMIRCVNPDFRP